MNRWDTYFHNLCVTVSSKSSCLSRKIGAILVRDQRVVATGYNGPPVGVPHCESCIRKEAGYKSGERLDWCPALHAEQNCINTAAYLGVITKGCTLYMNSLIPCFNCFKSLINSGIIEVIVEELTYYSPQTQFLAENSTIKVRTFDL